MEPEPEPEATICFLCKTTLTKSENGGVYCGKCAKTYDPELFPIDNSLNCSYYGKLKDGRQNTCVKIFGPMNQHWYHCKTCFAKKKDKGKGYCIFCSKKCQNKGHKLQLQYCTFVCDSV